MTRPTALSLAAALLATALFTSQASLAAADPERCGTVHFADVGWSDITVTTAVTRHVLSELGYITKVKRLSVPDTYKAMSEGRVDVFLGNWMPSMENDIRPYLENGTVESLGANLTGAKYSLAVNQAPMSISLLGMSFLSRLDSFHFEGPNLVLRWREGRWAAKPP